MQSFYLASQHLKGSVYISSPAKVSKYSLPPRSSMRDILTIHKVPVIVLIILMVSGTSVVPV